MLQGVCVCVCVCVGGGGGGGHSAILSTFIKLPFVIETYVLSFFEWPFYTGFTVISYTRTCPPVCGDNPRALASGLSYVQVDKHGITISYHLHQCRPCTS